MTAKSNKTLLIVHHTPSPHTQEMFEAVVSGASDPEIEGVEVVRRPALTVSPVEMLAADGYLLGTPANLGYMSGALKHAFDCAYYQFLDATKGRPFGLYLHGNEGTEGAERAVDGITAGLGWVKAAEYVVVAGKPSKDDLEACWELPESRSRMAAQRPTRSCTMGGVRRRQSRGGHLTGTLPQAVHDRRARRVDCRDDGERQPADVASRRQVDCGRDRDSVRVAELVRWRHDRAAHSGRWRWGTTPRSSTGARVRCGGAMARVNSQ